MEAVANFLLHLGLEVHVHGEEIHLEIVSLRLRHLFVVFYFISLGGLAFDSRSCRLARGKGVLLIGGGGGY